MKQNNIKNQSITRPGGYEGRKETKMFKKFIQRIIEAKGREDAIQNVFYGTIFDNSGKVIEYGIDTAYQHEKITWKEHQMLLALIEKMA